MRDVRFAVLAALIASCGGGPLSRRPAGPPPATNQSASEARRLLAQPAAIADRSRALQLFVRGCDAGDIESCASVVGSRLIRESDETALRHADVALWRSCEHGNFLSCRLAEEHGRLELEHTQLQPDCTAGVGAACFELAGESQPFDQKLLEQACNGSFLRACEKLTQIDTSWKTVRQRLLQRGCDAGYEYDCGVLANDYPWQGETDRELRKQEYAAAKRRCLSGVAESCHSALGTPLETIASKRMYCALDPLGCHDYAELVTGPDVPNDLVAARLAYASSCTWTAEHETRASDCAAAAKLYGQSYPNGPADPARAAELAKQACELGDTASCSPK
jgi:hypothetical protein